MNAVKKRGICIRVACQAFRISESCYRYERKLDAENDEVATWLIKPTDNNRNWGFGLCYLYLRNLKGFKAAKSADSELAGAREFIAIRLNQLNVCVTAGLGEFCEQKE